MKNIAIIFAGGTGERMRNSSRPKQFLEHRGKPVLAYTLERFQSHPEIDAIVLVSLRDWIDYCWDLARTYRFDKLVSIVPGGATAHESTRNGLEEARRRFGDDAVVLIHDGVRPFIDDATISADIAGVREFGSAITAVPATETVAVGGEPGARIVDRNLCQMVRAPQCFYLGDILRAHERARAEGREFIDSASMMNCYGHPLHTVLGPMENIKITTALDMQIFRALVDVQGGAREAHEVGEEPCSKP